MKKKIFQIFTIIFIGFFLLGLLYLGDLYIYTTNSSQCIESLKKEEVVLIYSQNRNEQNAVEPKFEVHEPFKLEKRKYFYQTDSKGFIVTDKNHQNPDLSIYFLGGSTTECIFVTDSVRFPEGVARKLENQYPIKINAYNCGVGRTNSAHTINLLQNKILNEQPDLLVFNHLVNDLAVLYYFEGVYYDNNNTRKLKSTIGDLYSESNCNNKSATYFSSLLDAVSQNKNPKDEFKDERDLSLKNDAEKARIKSIYRKSIRSLLALSEANNIPCILLSQPSTFNLIRQKIIKLEIRKSLFKNLSAKEEEAFKNDFYDLHYDFNKILEEEAQNYEVLFIDLAKEILQPEYFYDEVHLNDNGARLASQIISQKIIESNLLDSFQLSSNQN